MYNLLMTDISITDARADLAAVIKRAKKKPIRITHHGKPQAVLLDPSLYEQMIDALEELEDIEAVDAYKSNPSGSVTLEQLKRELGF